MNRKRLIITSTISIVLIAILMISSTYSIFTTSEVDENTNVYTTGNLDITYTLDSNNVTLTNITPISIEDENTVVPYRITVTNTGTVPYMFNVILNDTTASNVIDYQYIMTKVGYLESISLSDCDNNIIKEDIILPANSSVDIDVRVWISDQIQNSVLGKSFYAKLSIDGLAIYNESEDIDNDILSLKYMNTSSTANFRSNTYRDYIKTASFVNYIDTSNAAVDSNNQIISWDMSTNEDESVIAWLENIENSSDYNLYIGSNNLIYAKNLEQFFQDMYELENITFDNLDTSLTISMNEMFYDCESLTSLDLSNFNTSNVTGMSFMFLHCRKLISLDVSLFNTSKVTDMNRMFSGCYELTTLDISNFDTGKVTDMNRMFSNCYELTTLDLNNFDTSNVTDMQLMFYNCENLTTTITIKTTTSTSYENIFSNAAINEGAVITVNYTNNTSSLVDNMIATKSTNSNVVKGSLIG